MIIGPGEGCHSNFAQCEMRDGINWDNEISSYMLIRK